MRINFLSLFTLFLFACNTSFAQYEHFIPYHKGNLWGYKDAATGEVLIDPKFEKEPDFFDHRGFAEVSVIDSVCIINTNGKVLLCDRYFEYSAECRGIVVSKVRYQKNIRQNVFSFYDFNGNKLLSQVRGVPVVLPNLIYIRNGDTLSVYYYGIDKLKFLRTFTNVSDMQYDLTPDYSRCIGVYVEFNDNPSKLFFMDTLGKTKFSKIKDQPVEGGHLPVISPPISMNSGDVRLTQMGSRKGAPGIGIGQGSRTGERRKSHGSIRDSILRITYDTVWYTKGELYAAVKKGSYWGVVDTNGNVVVEMAYKRISVCNLANFAIPYRSRANREAEIIPKNFACFIAIDQNNRTYVLLPNGQSTTGNYSHMQRLSGPCFVTNDSTGMHGIIIVQENRILEIAPKFMNNYFGNTHNAVTKNCGLCYFFKVDDNGFAGWLRSDGVEFYER